MERGRTAAGASKNAAPHQICMPYVQECSATPEMYTIHPQQRSFIRARCDHRAQPRQRCAEAPTEATGSEALTAAAACSDRGAAPEKPSSAAPIEPMVTAMWSHDRKVRSLAKNVLGSMRCGMVVASLRSGCGFRGPGSVDTCERYLPSTMRNPYFKLDVLRDDVPNDIPNDIPKRRAGCRHGRKKA